MLSVLPLQSLLLLHGGTSQTRGAAFGARFVQARALDQVAMRADLKQLDAKMTTLLVATGGEASHEKQPAAPARRSRKKVLAPRNLLCSKCPLTQVKLGIVTPTWAHLCCLGGAAVCRAPTEEEFFPKDLSSARKIQWIVQFPQGKPATLLIPKSGHWQEEKHTYLAAAFCGSHHDSTTSCASLVSSSRCQSCTVRATLE